MQALDQLFLVWCFNTIIFATALYSIFAACGKAADVFLKAQQYEQAKKEGE